VTGGRAGAGGLIAFEGIDGCGKTTQARLLAERVGALLTFEPGATRLGATLRAELLDRHRSPVDERAEALLMAADRAQHVAEVIRPALSGGRWVVTDRFSASTLAYQGYGRGLARHELTALIEWATRGLHPDLTVLVDVDVSVASSRRTGSVQDRFEIEGAGFQQRVADGYHQLVQEAATPWLVVDGTRSVDEVAADIWLGVRPYVEGSPPGEGSGPVGAVRGRGR
jgi:dTMP kinase